MRSALDREADGGGTAMPLEDGLTVRLRTAVERVRKTGRNVVGLLPARAGDAAPGVVMLGAHYDHLGHGEMNSLATGDEEGQVHNGADDNASGCAVVLNWRRRWRRSRSAAACSSRSGRARRWACSAPPTTPPTPRCRSSR